jgi:glycine oxidase
MAITDITVIGAGVFGLSLAYVCARRGARVLVLDAAHIGAGSSGGVVGALAPHVPEKWNSKKAFQFESLRMAEGFWAQVAEVSGENPGYARLGRVHALAADALEMSLERAVNAKTLWQGFAQWQVCKASDLAGLRLATNTEFVVRETLSARLHPKHATLALAAAVRALGGVIIEGADTNGLASAKGPVVWATGYQGLLALSEGLARPVGAGEKGQAILLRHHAPDSPQLSADGLHIVPHDDGTVAVGSTTERWFDDATTTDARCDDLHARAIAACPELGTAPLLQRWAGARPRSRTRAPVLGPWPDRAGHFVMNGGFKIGFGMAPKLADVMADLVLEGLDQIPDGFRVSDCL